jgi:hypothetical protein
MPQDRESGAEADRFGREYGAKIIGALGAKKVKPGSNECLLGGRRVSIHCAHKHTNSVGMTLLCLKRLDAVLGAFEQQDGSFRILELSADLYTKHSRPTRSRGPSAGRVVLVRRTVFEQHGKLVRLIPSFDTMM